MISESVLQQGGLTIQGMSVKTVVDLKSCFLAVLVSNMGTGSPGDDTVFLSVQNLKDQKSPEVDVSFKTLAELHGLHVSRYLLLPESLSVPMYE